MDPLVGKLLRNVAAGEMPEVPTGMSGFRPRAHGRWWGNDRLGSKRARGDFFSANGYVLSASALYAYAQSKLTRWQGRVLRGVRCGLRARQIASWCAVSTPA